MSVRQILRTEPETLGHLELAAEERLHEARTLLADGRAHASVYLAGYAAEMTLKIATFRVDGARPSDLVDHSRLRPLRARATLLIGAVDPENFHSLKFWALLLRETRRHRGRPLDGSLAGEVVQRSLRIHESWGVAMRYRPRLLGSDEAKSALEDVGWLRKRASDLWR